jgi:molecular chaperone IbpA
MTRDSLVPVLSKLSNHYIGYDQLFDDLFSALNYDPRRGYTSSFAQNKFPPFNIEKMSDDTYTISVAVAGFKREDLSVELENNVLKITGNKSQTGENQNLIYQGIAERSFTRTFRLGDFIEVSDVKLEDGILSVNLYKFIPDNLKPKKLEIR